MTSIEHAIRQKQFKSEHHKMVINLLYTTSWLQGMQSQALKPYGISVQQFNIMRILRGQHPQAVSVNDIVDRMIDKNSNVSRLVEKMRLKGLIVRKECEKDRRRVDVTLTSKGLELLATMDQVMMEVQDYLHTLSAEEAKQMNALLDKLRTQP